MTPLLGSSRPCLDDCGQHRLAEMLARNVIARAMLQGDIIGLAPPMCLTRAEADLVVAATKEALDDFNPV